MKKIIVVDDDEAILAVTSYLLTTNGFTVFTSATGLNVAQMVRMHSPDIVLLDIRLPGISGIDICKELKNVFNIPVVLFSAHSDRISALQDSAADAFIQKPFDIKKFISLINLYATCKLAEV